MQQIARLFLTFSTLYFMNGCVTSETSDSGPRITDQSKLAEVVAQRKEAFFVYPDEAKQFGWGGWVIVEATVTNEGELANVAAYEHSGCEPLVVDAIDQVEKLFPIPADLSISYGKVLNLRIPYHYKHDESPPPKEVASLQHRIAEYLKWTVKNIQKYPSDSLREGHEGTVLTKFIIQRDAIISDVEIVESSGHSELDEDAINTIKQIGTSPSSRCLQIPHSYEVLFPVTYSLDEFKSQAVQDYEWLRTEIAKRIQTSAFYPQDARDNRIEGRVIVSADVTDQGKISRTWIVHGSSNSLLDQAAIFIVQSISPISLKHKLARPSLRIYIPIQFKL